jgi:hypothetical protein
VWLQALQLTPPDLQLRIRLLPSRLPTVNKEIGGGKKSVSGLGKTEKHRALKTGSRKGAATRKCCGT